MLEELVDLEEEFGFRPESAVSGGFLFQTEHRAVVTFNASQKSDRPSSLFPGKFMYVDSGTGIFRFFHRVMTRWGDSRHGYEGSIHEVKNSLWARMQLERDISLDARSRRLPTEASLVPMRHLVFGFHDGNLECLTGPFEFELSKAPYLDIVAKIMREIDEF